MRPVQGWTAAVLGVALVCTGCGSEPELDADRAKTLQDSVLAVTQAASESRWSDAQVLLADTRTVLEAGADTGDVSATRYRAIDTALDHVEAELAASQAAAEIAAAAQATADQAAASQAPAPAPTAGDSNGGPGGGKDKGKSRGKSGK